MLTVWTASEAGAYQALLVCRIRKGPIRFRLLNTCKVEELRDAFAANNGWQCQKANRT
jgi:hypothetical protein